MCYRGTYTRCRSKYSTRCKACGIVVISHPPGWHSHPADTADAVELEKLSSHQVLPLPHIICACIEFKYTCEDSCPRQPLSATQALYQAANGTLMTHAKISVIDAR